MAKVNIIMKGGVVGEDQSDWFAGEAHDASPAFARELVKRGLAGYATGADAEEAEGLGFNPSEIIVTNGDPALKNADPKVAKKG